MRSGSEHREGEAIGRAWIAARHASEDNGRSVLVPANPADSACGSEVATGNLMRREEQHSDRLPAHARLELHGEGPAVDVERLRLGVEVVGEAETPIQPGAELPEDRVER